MNNLQVKCVNQPSNNDLIINNVNSIDKFVVDTALSPSLLDDTNGTYFSSSKKPHRTGKIEICLVTRFQFY